MSELAPAACQCPFVSHHHGPCGAEGVHATGRVSRVTLCRECLTYLAGETRAAKEEAAKRQTAGLRVGNEKKPNDSPLAPVGAIGHGPSAEIAAKAVGIGRNTVERAAQAPLVVAGFRFG